MDTNNKLEALKQFYSEIEGKNHFELLGVAQDADDAAIRSAYFGQMKKYGADYFHHVTDPESRKAVDEVNRQLRLAYDAIGKKSKREAYIASLNGESEAPADKAIDIAEVFEAEQALSQARILMERGEFGVATKKLEKARKIDGSNTEIKVRLFYAQFMTMTVDEHNKRNPIAVKEIRETLENACEEMPNAGYLRSYLGDIENLEGNQEDAVKWYKQALKIEPDNLTAKRQLMLIEERQNKAAQEPAPTSFLDKIKALFHKKL
ncbi:MAG: hypothetical protein IKY83_12645 [Proteobacteria bacterium]|nr:hypothetical protein [Pseudomonadota bacterium]